MNLGNGMGKKILINVQIIAMTGLYPMSSSGPGIFLYGLISYLSGKGYRGEIFTTPSSRMNDFHLTSYSLHSWAVNKSFIRKLFSYINFLVCGLISVRKNDLVLFNSPPIDIFSASIFIASIITNKPSIWVVHGSTFIVNLKKSFWTKHFINFFSSKVSEIVAVSNSLAKIISENIEREPITIYSALSLIEPRSKFDHNESDKLLFIFLGRLDPIKRVDLLIRAFAEIIKNHNNSRLCIIGDGFEKKHLEELCSLYNLNQVTFCGFLEGNEKTSILDVADILVLPSDYETFGLVILEAWARGVNVIGSRTGGIEEIVDSQRTGLLFEPGSWFGLYECMEKLYDANLRKRLSDNAYQELVEKYLWNSAGEKYDSLIVRIVKRKPLTNYKNG
jgi:glycosyltransferase involved in cell wall biosynthesis